MKRLPTVKISKWFLIFPPNLEQSIRIEAQTALRAVGASFEIHLESEKPSVGKDDVETDQGDSFDLSIVQRELFDSEFVLAARTVGVNKISPNQGLTAIPIVSSLPKIADCFLSRSPPKSN